MAGGAGLRVPSRWGGHDPWNNPTTLVLRPAGAASAADLAAVRRILRARFNAAGLVGVELAVTGSTITVTTSGGNAFYTAEMLSHRGTLELRPVVRLPDVPSDGHGPEPTAEPPTPEQGRALAAHDCTRRPPDRTETGAGIVACIRGYKIILGPALFGSESLAGARQAPPSADADRWRVMLRWTEAARRVWADHTRRHNVTTMPDEPGNRVAFLVDGDVLEAPETEGPAEGPETEFPLSSSSGEAGTRNLTAYFRTGPLPIPMTVTRGT